MNTPGTNVVIGDADAIIALSNRDDALFEQADAVLTMIDERGSHLIFPSTALVEAVTALQRKMSNSVLASKVVDQIQKKQFVIEAVDSALLQHAVAIYNPLGSKQNTLFDAIVAATAHKYQADAIFSFDDWYTKHGFTLAKAFVTA